MKIQQLQAHHFDQVYQLMSEAFPESERRDYAGQKALLKRDDYHLYGMTDHGRVVAFLAVYAMQAFCFVEHLAVDPSLRGTGIGKRILQNLMAQVGKPVILEVEKPIDVTTKRRVQFYERAGFTLYATDYVQPPLQKGQNPLALYLMCYPKLSIAQWDSIIHTIHTAVYCI